MLSACSENETTPVSEEGQYVYTFQVGNGDNPDSKTTFGKTCIEWKAGDKIGIYTVGAAGNSQNNSSAVTVGTPCTIYLKSTYALASGDKVYTYYPYKKSTGTDPAAAKLTIPVTQTNGDADAMPMVGLPFTMTSAADANTDTPVGKINYCNLGAGIMFNIYSTNSSYTTEKIKKVVFEANKAIAGSFTFDLTKVDYTNASTLAISGYTEKSVGTEVASVAIPASKTAVTTPVGMVVAPGTYSGKLSVVTDNATYSFTLTTTSYTRNTKSTINVNLANGTREKKAGLKLLRATSSTLAFQFSSTNFLDPATDISKTYKAAIYTDAACSSSNLVVSWVLHNSIGSDSDKQTADLNWKATEGPRFVFAGLDKNTTYYAKVTDITDAANPIESSVVSGTTLDFTPVKISSTVPSTGDVILAEDFSEIAWGGSLADEENAAGYWDLGRSTATSFAKATGENPKSTVSVTTKTGFAVCPRGQNSGFFSTLANEVKNSRLADWGYLPETGGKASKQAGAVCSLAGSLQLGASSYVVELVTPQLTCLGDKTATVTLTFDVQSAGDKYKTVHVDHLTASTIKSFLVTSTASSEILKKTLTNTTTMKTMSVDIPNVTKNSRIAIGGKRSNGGTVGTAQERFYIDNIKITVKSIN